MEENQIEQKPEEPKSVETKTQLGVGVQFKPAGKVYTFTTDDETLSKHDGVMVESTSGETLGTIIQSSEDRGERKIPKNAKRVLRRASDDDMQTWRKNGERAMECFHVCKKKAAEQNLQMKLIDAEVSTNGNKVTFTFFAEQRVDFRTLVKELAQALRMRIEMKQIGARDEAKNIPCMGPCGRPTCCSLHLRQFQSISISMAKHQGLSPNPSKITGMCGKLKCCLAYEHAVYAEQRKGLPKLGSAVECPKGTGKVVGHNVLKRECTVRLYGGAGETRHPAEECKKITADERDAAIEAMRKKREEEEEKRSARRRPRRGNDRSNKKPERKNERHSSNNKRPNRGKNPK